jgi:hypothetical protein
MYAYRFNISNFDSEMLHAALEAIFEKKKESAADCKYSKDVRYTIYSVGVEQTIDIFLIGRGEPLYLAVSL